MVLDSEIRKQLKLEDLAKLKEILKEKRRLAYNQAIRKAEAIASQSWTIGADSITQAEATKKVILELLRPLPKKFTVTGNTSGKRAKGWHAKPIIAEEPE